MFPTLPGKHTKDRYLFNDAVAVMVIDDDDDDDVVYCTVLYC